MNSNIGILIVTSACLLASITMTAMIYQDNKNYRQLEYVFETVRHGARAPLVKNSQQFKRFNVSADDMLSPQGMRQRYLLGRYNFEKYLKPIIYQDDDELELDIIKSQEKLIQMQSTDVYRTLQSGYSELLGLQQGAKMSNLSDQFILSQAQLNSSQNNIAPFKIRRQAKIQQSLGKKPIVDGFVHQPIYTYIEEFLEVPEWNDDMYVGACPYVNKVKNQRQSNDQIYEDLFPLKHLFYSDLMKQYGKSEDYFKSLIFDEFELFLDMVYCEIFELIPQKVNWTSQQLKNIDLILTEVLLRPFDDYSSKLWVSKHFSKPLDEIRSISKNLEQYKESNNPLYRIYSAHDTNVANILRIITPNYKYDVVPFSAQFVFEVYSQGKDKVVRTTYNGKEMILDQCGGQIYCPIQTFLYHMDTVLFTKDIKKLCYEQPKQRQLLQTDAQKLRDELIMILFLSD